MVVSHTFVNVKLKKGQRGSDLKMNKIIPTLNKIDNIIPTLNNDITKTNMIKNEGGQIVSRGLCLSGSWYNDHSQHLQHPEPSGSFSQDFNLPIQAMMNPVVF